MIATRGRTSVVPSFVTRTLRYSMASVVAVVSGQTTLIVCAGPLGVDAVAANLIACTAGAVPSYLLNRAWTWQRRGRHSLLREVLPFWMMTLLGLALSTVAVAFADRRWGTTLAVSAANLAAFGALWVVKFAVLDRVLFAPPAEDGAGPS